MQHSKHFDKVKYYYEHCYWNKWRCWRVVGSSWLNRDEYKELTGEEWSEFNEPERDD